MSYPDDWDSRRQLVFLSDGYECRHCGEKGGQFGAAELECHHIIPKRMNGSDQPENLVTLCRQCHEEVHREDRDGDCRPRRAGFVISGSSLAALPALFGTAVAGLYDTAVTALIVLALGLVFAVGLGGTSPTVALTALGDAGALLFETTYGWLPWVLALLAVRYVRVLAGVVRRRRGRLSWAPRVDGSPGPWPLSAFYVSGGSWSSQLSRLRWFDRPRSACSDRWRTSPVWWLSRASSRSHSFRLTTTRTTTA